MHVLPIIVKRVFTRFQSLISDYSSVQQGRFGRREAPDLQDPELWLKLGSNANGYKTGVIARPLRSDVFAKHPCSDVFGKHPRRSGGALIMSCDCCLKLFEHARHGKTRPACDVCR